MIEAVNSTLQNASLLRASAGQMSAAESFAANPARIQKVGRAPYMSVFVDVNYDTAVLQFRNGETRDVIDQIPSETLLENRARDEARRAELQRQASQPKSEQPVSVTAQATSPEIEVQSAPVPAEEAPAPRVPSAPTHQQIAAFTNAARAGSSGTNAGVSVLA
ncbi:MAG: hypothetical protein HYS17_10340 [Micavibrio aeruginosavorus]|uniref:Uncharacterized protein n=1 Tax=Micavibrio aeruginosavorus TaxID=349221 RepID=A0A7T5R1N0_9BACT|nr:MAG: hypothetical protein HYS17_10340 [Micavibrio aeruginosavorus]